MPVRTSETAWTVGAPRGLAPGASGPRQRNRAGALAHVKRCLRRRARDQLALPWDRPSKDHASQRELGIQLVARCGHGRAGPRCLGSRNRVAATAPEPETMGRNRGNSRDLLPRRGFATARADRRRQCGKPATRAGLAGLAAGLWCLAAGTTERVLIGWGLAALLLSFGMHTPGLHILHRLGYTNWINQTGVGFKEGAELAGLLLVVLALWRLSADIRADLRRLIARHRPASGRMRALRRRDNQFDRDLRTRGIPGRQSARLVLSLLWLPVIPTLEKPVTGEG